MTRMTQDEKREQTAERRAALDALKLAQGGCVDCGYNEHPAALHWDHVDDKTHRHGQAVHPSWSWARILAEVAKCEVVCANCHAVKTAERGYQGGRPMHGMARKQPLARVPRAARRRPLPVKHGTGYRYSKGCRCDACCEAKREERRRYEQRR